jgi:methionyl-tRNA formyltransferase
MAANLPVHQPEKIHTPEAEQLLEKLAPDGIVIIAYGQIIPARLLPIPALGWINLHASLLPKFRGAAPVNWAIADGEMRTGVTTMRIDAGMDTGDILLQRQVQIGPFETAPELAKRLSEIGAPLLGETLRGLAAGTLAPRSQNHAEATHAPLLRKQDGRIDWNLPAQQIFNRIRGFAPWPGAYTTFRGQTCHIWGEPVSEGVGDRLRSRAASGVPGTLLVKKSEILVWCGDRTVLRLRAVKLEGRKQITAAEFANGAHLGTSERFGDT